LIFETEQSIGTTEEIAKEGTEINKTVNKTNVLQLK